MSSVAACLNAGNIAEAAVADRTAEAARCILFFDGTCGLCNKAVDFVLLRDRRRNFQFAPLQGTTARQLLSAAEVQDLNSMVLLVAGRPYRRSAAAVRILWHLDLRWRLVGTLLWLIPLPVRDIGYRVVASNRYRFFGQHETCRMPTAEERSRFLP